MEEVDEAGEEEGDVEGGEEEDGGGGEGGGAGDQREEEGGEEEQQLCQRFPRNAGACSSMDVCGYEKARNFCEKSISFCHCRTNVAVNLVVAYLLNFIATTPL